MEDGDGVLPVVVGVGVVAGAHGLQKGLQPIARDPELAHEARVVEDGGRLERYIYVDVYVYARMHLCVFACMYVSTARLAC